MGEFQRRKNIKFLERIVTDKRISFDKKNELNFVAGEEQGKARCKFMTGVKKKKSNLELNMINTTRTREEKGKI